MTRCRSLVALSVLSLLPDAHAQSWFDAPRIVTGVDAVLAAGDLDQDGDVDLAGASAGAIVTLRNDGTGEFAPGPVQILLPGSSTTNDPARLGDIDGDGRLDLVMNGGSEIHVYFGFPGGGFAAGVAVAVPVAVSSFALGDMNADGRLDVAIGSSFAQRVGWVFHDGQSFHTTAFPPTGDFIARVAALDADGDGRSDLAASLSDRNEVLLALTVAGQPVVGSTLVTGTAGSKGAGLAAGDVDADGDDDLVAIYNDSQDLEVVVIEHTPSGLQALSGQTFPGVGYEVNDWGVRLGDWHGDGDLDLVTQTLLKLFGQGRVRAFLVGNGGGTHYDAFFEAPVDGLGWVAGLADVDGDGDADLIGADTIVPGDGTLAGFEFSGNTTIAIDSRVLDVDGDGDLDVRRLGQAFLNDATGALTSVPDLFPSPGAGLEFREGVHADFDQDGIEDAVVEKWQPSGSVFQPDTFLEMVLLRGLGTGFYAIQGPAAAPGVHLVAPVAGDYDLDGDVDLLTQADPGGLPAAIWKNQGDGTFAFTIPAPAGTIEDQGDYDLDGDVDLLAQSGNALLAHANLGGGAFQTATLVNQDTLDQGSRLLDLDGDGDLDALAHTTVSDLFGLTSTLRPVENLGGGAFAAASPLDLGGVDTDVYGVADVDGDGLLDLLAAANTHDGGGTEDASYGRVLAFRRAGPGLAYAAPAWFIGHRPAAFSDMDGDGDTDVLGRTLVRSRRFEGPSAGLIRQFGAGTAGSGGAVPIVGASGPARVGSPTYEFRAVRGLGGGAALLVLGSSEVDVANAPVLGAHFYVGNLILTLPVILPGPPGAPGLGGFSIPAAIPPALLGVRVVHQTLHADPQALFGVSTSNGLEVVFGG